MANEGLDARDGRGAGSEDRGDGYVRVVTRRFGLLHTVDARVGEEHVEGAEIIGWDPERDAYATQYFGSDGPSAYEARLTEEDGALVWSMRSSQDRFTGTFSKDGNTITGHWEQLDDEENWQPWMDVKLTKPG